MRSTGLWIAVVAAILGGAGALSLSGRTARETGSVATVSVDGRCIRTIDLDRVEAPYSFTVAGVGTNIVTVERGRIRISRADCPTQRCVRQGWLSPGGLPLVCLPHRLVISLGSSSTLSVDHVSR